MSARTSQAYLFVYFTGEDTPDAEAVHMAVTEGDDPLDGWVELAGGRAVLTSTLGEGGLRDPHLLRSPAGERFYLLATDLRIHGGNDFGAAQEHGSRSIAVWESRDLVQWSEQRLVEVSGPEVGNTWAPEAFWDDERGEYVVYWASALYPAVPGPTAAALDRPDPAPRRIADSYQRMLLATTTDFTTFTAPQVWIDDRRGPGRGMIDSTVVRDGTGTYYRFTKDEASMLPRLERSADLRSTSWELVAERLGEGQPNPWGGVFTAGEGPTALRSGTGEHWYLFVDQPGYHGGQGYMAFAGDLTTGTFTAVDARLPRRARHGTVLAVTAEERDRLLAAYGG